MKPSLSGRMPKDVIQDGSIEDIKKYLYEDEVFSDEFAHADWGWIFTPKGAYLPEGFKLEKTDEGKEGKKLFISFKDVPFEKVNFVTVVGDQKSKGNKCGLSKPIFVKVSARECKQLDGKYYAVVMGYTGWSCSILVRGMIIELK